MFNVYEEQFLAGSHPIVEQRNGWTSFPALPDGLPEGMRQRVLEARAKLLGRKFVEFRSRMTRERAEIVRDVTSNLADLF